MMKYAYDKDGELEIIEGKTAVFERFPALRSNKLDRRRDVPSGGVVRPIRVVRPEPDQGETWAADPEPLTIAEDGWCEAVYPLVKRPIEELRAEAAMPRTDFALLAAAQGWVAEAEALAWVGGTAIPGWVEQIIDTNIPAADRLLVKAQTLTDPTVRRMGALMPMLQAAKGVSDAELDALFGIA
jgi:hypothetical protein